MHITLIALAAVDDHLHGALGYFAERLMHAGQGEGMSWPAGKMSSNPMTDNCFGNAILCSRAARYVLTADKSLQQKIAVGRSVSSSSRQAAS